MTIVVNGKDREVYPACDVAALIAKLGLPAPATLVELNGEALRRDEWSGRLLGEGDRVELVRIAAGG